jgi:hypothetical protein
LTSPSTSVTTTVRQGIPSVAVSLTANATPGWITSNLSFNLDASVEAPITLLQYAVGTASGAVSGLGNIDYTQFQIRAYDDTGQFNYSLPITWDGVSNYGGFKYSYLRAPMPSGTRLYNFVVASGGDYSSSTDISDITYNAVTNLASPILISPLNAYLAVTVTYNGGKSYPYGAWVQAQPCPGGVCPSPVTTGLGNGLFVGNLYSGVTKGDGTVLVPVQLQNGGATSYVLNAQYIDLTNNYAVTNKFVTIGPVSQTATYLSPSGQSINY